MSAVSRQSNNLPAMKSEDLRCMICTKASKFSDISHLLTHISSKQHLSNYFKVRVAADEDADSQLLLNKFNTWFERWNMPVLLRERMQQKEKKKNSGRTNIRKAAVPTLPQRALARTKSHIQAVQLPPLSNASGTPEPSNLQPHFNGMPMGLSYNSAVENERVFPPVPAWSNADPHVKLEPEEYDSDVQYNPEQTLAPTYFLRRQPSHVNDDDSAFASSSLHSSTLLEEANEEEKEIARLKGTVWPGMDLFDSATPEMQRKRNQKKEVNVVVQLQATSLSVEPNELIYNLNGEFLKQRTISGDPTIVGTPLKGESEPEPDSPEPKKKRGGARRPREPLAQLDENAPGKRRSIRSRKGQKMKYSGPYLDDTNDEITYGAGEYKKRNGIRIHRDESGPDITFDQPPTAMTYLNSGFNYAAGLPRDVHGRGHSSMLRSDTPMGLGMSLSGRFDHSNTRHAFKNTSTGHMPYDLSTFGHLTSLFQPSVYNVMSAGGYYQGNSSSTGMTGLQPPFSHELQHAGSRSASSGTNGFAQAMPNWDVFNVNTGNVDEQPLPSTFSGYNGFDLDNADVSPLFFHSDQAFPADGDQTQTQPAAAQMIENKEEQESNADTISLGSDQK